MSNSKILTDRTNQSSNPSPPALTSHRHHIHSTGPVACWRWPSEPPNQQLAQRVAKSTTRVPARTFSNPIRHIANAITPFRGSGSPPMHPHPPHGPAAANESRVPDAGSASPGAQDHIPPCCTALIAVWPKSCITSMSICYLLLQLSLLSSSTSRDVTAHLHLHLHPLYAL